MRCTRTIASVDSAATAQRVRRFPSTHWSIVAASGTATPAARVALEVLCRRYWHPVYAYIRRRGHPHHAAEDLAQTFFAHVVQSGALARAEPRRGRFRTFLLAAVAHYLTDDWRRAHAQKRDIDALRPLCAVESGEHWNPEPPDPALTPEETFDRTWALMLIAEAIQELRDEYHAAGRDALFAALGSSIWDEPGRSRPADLAAELGMSSHAVAVMLSRLRLQLRERLRRHIADTVVGEADAADEMRHLLGAIRANRAGSGFE